jgi:hypothetical protein
MMDKGFVNVQLYASRSTHSIDVGDLIGELEKPVELGTVIDGITGA